MLLLGSSNRFSCENNSFLKYNSAIPTLLNKDNPLILKWVVEYKCADLPYNPDIIDINYGCPVPKVTKRGAGSAALKNLSIMRDITTSVIKNVKNTPITVKMRSGWTVDSYVYVDAGQMLEEIGISAITLHPRTTSQKFEGTANWKLIKELKDNVNIPVIGNGDVKNIDDYIRIVDETNCDAVMIGRGALGNPWIFTKKRLNSLYFIVP